jgi:hypothetical protein
VQQINCVTLSGVPFNNAAGNDFSLNSTSGQGLACQGVGEWQPLFAKHPPAWIRPLSERPWPKSVREVAVYEWWPTRIVDFTRWRPLDTVVA